MYCKYASMYGVEYLMDTMQVYHVSASALRVAVQGSGGFSTRPTSIQQSLASLRLPSFSPR